MISTIVVKLTELSGVEKDLQTTEVFEEDNLAVAFRDKNSKELGNGILF